MLRALLVIDLQNDYFPGGEFPLWNTEAVLLNTERAIEKAKARGSPHHSHPARCRQHDGHRPVLQRGDDRG
jgi:nicotinamidase-related amidase